MFKTKVLATAVALLAAAGLLLWSLSRSQVPYVKVDELLGRTGELQGRKLWLGGRVVPGSHLWKAGQPPLHRFHLEWGGRQVEVFYRGTLPAGFQEGRQVTLEGRLGGDGIFHAKIVTTKCPSKYRARQETADGRPR